MKEHALKISSAAIALIKKHQGLSLEKYRDEKGLWVDWPPESPDSWYHLS